jgi:hypothetical protein
MRDWRSGSQWDTRTFDDLRYCRIRVNCKACRHYADFRPEQLAWQQPPRRNWLLIIPRFRCSVCEERQAHDSAEPLPRN